MRPSFRGKKSRGQRSLPPEAARRGCAQANVELVWPIAARRQTLPGWQLPRRWVRFVMFPGYWPTFPYIQPRRCATQRGRVFHKHKMAQKNVSGAGIEQLQATQALPQTSTFPSRRISTPCINQLTRFRGGGARYSIWGQDVTLRSGSSNGTE